MLRVRTSCRGAEGTERRFPEDCCGFPSRAEITGDGTGVAFSLLGVNLGISGSEVVCFKGFATVILRLTTLRGLRAFSAVAAVDTAVRDESDRDLESDGNGELESWGEPPLADRDLESDSNGEIESFIEVRALNFSASLLLGVGLVLPASFTDNLPELGLSRFPSRILVVRDLDNDNRLDKALVTIAPRDALGGLGAARGHPRATPSSMTLSQSFHN